MLTETLNFRIVCNYLTNLMNNLPSLKKYRHVITSIIIHTFSFYCDVCFKYIGYSQFCSIASTPSHTRGSNLIR